MNTPVGIPSGWEEIAAYSAHGLHDIMFWLEHAQLNGVQGVDYIHGRHDWRVVE